jgi:hypothetical protein
MARKESLSSAAVAVAGARLDPHRLRPICKLYGNTYTVNAESSGNCKFWRSAEGSTLVEHHCFCPEAWSGERFTITVPYTAENFWDSCKEWCGS